MWNNDWNIDGAALARYALNLGDLLASWDVNILWFNKFNRCPLRNYRGSGMRVQEYESFTNQSPNIYRIMSKENDTIRLSSFGGRAFFWVPLGYNCIILFIYSLYLGTPR